MFFLKTNSYFSHLDIVSNEQDGLKSSTQTHYEIIVKQFVFLFFYGLSDEIIDRQDIDVENEAMFFVDEEKNNAMPIGK